MKAAREEVQKVFDTFGLKVDPNNSTLNLTREHLDNMPVLGKMTSKKVICSASVFIKTGEHRSQTKACNWENSQPFISAIILSAST